MGGSVLWLLISCIIFVEGAEIQNARAIVTGGANGIGYACVRDLLLRGAQVAILDIDVENGTMATQGFVDQFGDGRVFFIPTDVSDPFLFEMDFSLAVQLLGGLDIMINNAGISDETIWGKVIDTNLKGVIQGTLMSFDVMGKHKGGNGGTVVNIASIFSFMAVKYFPAYTASKAGVLGFSRSIALSYNVTGVDVKIMCPGYTNTNMFRSKAHRYFDFIDYNEVIEVMGNLKVQEPEDLSRETMRLIEEAPSGAIWVVEKDQPTISLDIPQYRDWGTPV